MSDLDALLAGIVDDPHTTLRWLILADWLDDHEQPDRAELLRLHREMIRTCCEPAAHPERAEWQARMVELLDLGTMPCVPRRELTLPGGVPLVGHFIPPGTFLMGTADDDADDDEEPVHAVTLSRGFFLGLAPVTQEQWRAVMGTNPSSFAGDRRPVETVSWASAVEFCTRASEQTGTAVRLPTEAEWEYACRAGSTTYFHYGDAPDARRMNYNTGYTWHDSPVGESVGRTTDVGSYPPNPWGLYDTHGNVLEWCQDWMDTGFYARSPAVDPLSGAEAGDRVCRGGAWLYDPDGARSALRNWRTVGHEGDDVGFRVAFEMNDTESR